MLFVFYLIDI